MVSATQLCWRYHSNIVSPDLRDFKEIFDIWLSTKHATKRLTKVNKWQVNFLKTHKGDLGMIKYNGKLEQLERLHSEDTRQRLMITHTIESYWIPSEKKTNYKFKEFSQMSNFWISKQALQETHLILLNKMCKYEMDTTSIVGDTERTRFCPQTDIGTRWNQYTPLSTSLKLGV